MKSDLFECRECGILKPAEAFHKRSKSQRGLHPYCKECRRHRRRRRRSNPIPDSVAVLMTRVCLRCHVEKPLTEFWVSVNHELGRWIYCKICGSQMTAEYRSTANGKATKAAVQRRYARTIKGRAAHKTATGNYVTQHPEKTATRRATKRAVRSGVLTPTACAICGSAKVVECHHLNYDDPHDVIWLCQMHHLEHHGKILWKELEVET